MYISDPKSNENLNFMVVWNFETIYEERIKCTVIFFLAISYIHNSIIIYFFKAWKPPAYKRRLNGFWFLTLLSPQKMTLS